LPFIIPRLLLSENDFNNLNKLLFPIVIVAIISQFYSYTVGSYFADTLNGGIGVRNLAITDDRDNISRAANSSFILLFCFVNAIFYFFSKKQIFNKTYLLLIIFFAFFSVFLSATRGWILGYTLIILLTIFFISKSKRLLLPIVSYTCLILLCIITIYPKTLIQLQNASERLLTIESLASGDITAEGTLSRLDERGPRVLNKFNESPVFGWGFSENYFDFRDNHVGHHNLLLNVGVIGYILLNILFFKWCFNIYIISKKNTIPTISNNSSIYIYMFALFGMYIIHSSSAQAWGLDISVAHVLFYSLLLQRISYFALLKQFLKND
jgi:hypothetical protein